MNKHVVNNVVYLTFDILDKANVKHCFSTRLGGVSEGCYTSLNLGFNRGDSDENVQKNFSLLCSAVGLDYDGLVFSDQIHGISISQVTKHDKGSKIKNTDGLMTNETGVVLTTYYADCVPLYFFDPNLRVAALSHAGWRGTLAEIGAITIKEMERVYGCRSCDILVGIGPSIGSCCFEVDSNVAEQFKEKLPPSKPFITPARDKYYIDLWRINKQSLLNAGVLDSHIEISGLCTKCLPELFYSHRLSGLNRGSLAAFISLDFL